MLSTSQINDEIIWSIAVAIFFFGFHFSILKKLDLKIKEQESDLKECAKTLAVHSELIKILDQKINRIENQNQEILKILTQKLN